MIRAEELSEGSEYLMLSWIAVNYPAIHEKAYHAVIDPNTLPPLDEDLVSEFHKVYVNDGYVSAIKLYRSRFNYSIGQAKDAIDLLIKKHEWKPE